MIWLLIQKLKKQAVSSLCDHSQVRMCQFACLNARACELYLHPCKLVHTYDASKSISASKSTCEPGQRKLKRKRRKKNPFLLTLVLVLASPRFTHTFSCAYVCTYACVVRVNQP